MSLPNSKSKIATLGSTRIDLHYAKLGIYHRWTWERFLRLCGFLRLTPAEMASAVCMPHSHLDGCHRRNRFPPPVSLLLTMIESQACKGMLPDIIENPMPDLNG